MLAGGVPVLALDMYEHAYHLDFGANATAYVEAFLCNIHWKRIEGRYLEAAGHLQAEPAAREDRIRPNALLAMLDRGVPAVILNVCADEDRPRRHDIIPGARIGTPEEIVGWAGDLPRDLPIIVACLYGFEKSADVVAALRAGGCDARQLSGGMAAWQAMAGPTELLTANS